MFKVSFPCRFSYPEFIFIKFFVPYRVRDSNIFILFKYRPHFYFLTSVEAPEPIIAECGTVRIFYFQFHFCSLCKPLRHNTRTRKSQESSIFNTYIYKPKPFVFKIFPIIYYFDSFNLHKSSP